MTIEQAVQDYLEDQSSHHRRPKTLQWHQQALGLFQHYLLTEHLCLLLGQLMEAEVRGWLAFLPQMPTTTGALTLEKPILDAGQHSSKLLNTCKVLHGCLFGLLRQRLDEVGAAQRIDRVGHPALMGDNLLGAQSDQHRFLCRERQCLIERVCTYTKWVR